MPSFYKGIRHGTENFFRPAFGVDDAPSIY